MSEDLLVSTENGVLVVRFDRPEKVNALGRRHLSRLAEAVRAAGQATGIVLTGEGGSFSSGFDLDDQTGTSADDEIDEMLADLERAIAEVPVPVIAAVEGACVGAGCDIAVMCDLVVAGRNAFFTVPAVKLGIVYRTPAVREVMRRAGSQAAALLFLLGERIPAPRARELGLIAEVVPDGGSLDRARALIDASARGVPEALAATKRLLRELRGAEAG